MTLPSAASAQAANYRDALQCSAIFTALSTFAEEADPEGGAVLQDAAVRWLVMAIRRSTDEGASAEADLLALALNYSERMELLGDDDAGLEREFGPITERCFMLQEANAEEYLSIDMSE